MTAIADFFAGSPILAGVGTFLCAAALFYIVVRRTMKKRAEEQS